MKLTFLIKSEAMWIDVDNRNNILYQIKVYAGGINAVSGEPFG